MTKQAAYVPSMADSYLIIVQANLQVLDNILYL